MANTWNAAAAAELRAQMARSQTPATTVAARSDMSVASVHRKIKDERPITLDEFAAMSLALGIEPDEMFTTVSAALGETHALPTAA